MNRMKTGAVAVAAAFLLAPAVLTAPAKAYTIDYSYAFGAGQGSSARTNNKYIVLHDVGTESGAAANANYFKNNWNVSYSYTQFAVGDGGRVYQIGEPGYQAWGAGEYANSNSPVQIELGHASNYATFKADYAAYVALAHDMALKFNIPLRFNNANGGIITHHFVSQNFWGDHVDPDGYLAKWGVSLDMLGRDVCSGISSLGSANNVISNPAKSTANTQASTQLISENWHFKNGNQPIQARYSPSLSGTKAGQLPAGCTVNYDSYVNSDGYTWVHYISYSGDDIYLPVHPTGSANNVWGSFK